MLKLAFSILLIMVPTMIFGYMDMSTQMTIALFAGFASAAIINIDKFEYFKAGQLEAKLREADKVIEEAHATIDQLKEVAEPLFNTNLVSIIYDGYFDGMDLDDKVKAFTELMEVEQKLKLDSISTKELVEKAKRAIAYDLFRKVGSIINKDPLSSDTMFFSKYSVYQESPVASLEEIEEYFNQHRGLENEEVNKAFNDFKRFINKYY